MRLLYWLHSRVVSSPAVVASVSGVLLGTELTHMYILDLYVYSCRCNCNCSGLIPMVSCPSCSFTFFAFGGIMSWALSTRRTFVFRSWLDTHGYVRGWLGCYAIQGGAWWPAAKVTKIAHAYTRGYFTLLSLNPGDHTDYKPPPLKLEVLVYST